MSSVRIVDSLLVDEGASGDLEAVDELLVALLADLDQLGDAPSPGFLDELVGATGTGLRRPARRGLRIVVASSAVLLGAAGTAAAAGSLPTPLQAAAHAVAGTVGIHVPDGEQGPPTSGGSQDGEGHGRSDEAPGRPATPGQPTDPNRSDEAPGQPEDPGSLGVGSDGTPPGDAGDTPAGEVVSPNAGEGADNSDDGIGNAQVPDEGEDGESNADPNAGEGSGNADEGADNGGSQPSSAG